MDALFVTPNSSEKAYQDLAKVYSAIEPPTWSLLLSESCRSKSYGVEILDTDAERLTLEESANRIIDCKARLVIFVLYGQNPNSGTTMMIGAETLAKDLKANNPKIKIGFIGSHTSALPQEVIKLNYVDFAFINEGLIALLALLKTNLRDNLEKIPGIWFKDSDGTPRKGLPGQIVLNEKMDDMMPGYAWDLLPFNKKPLDLYRAPMWHAEYIQDKRSPYAALQTSLGCQFGCNFCIRNNSSSKLCFRKRRGPE